MDLATTINQIYNASTPEEEVKVHVNNICAKISSNAIRLVDLVEALGPKLTSTEVQDRVKGMDFLSKVFTILKRDFLSEKELTFIVDFLHDRLKDQHVVIPKVFLCILPIVRCKHLPEGSTTKLLNQLFQEGNIQSHTHPHRRAVFQTIQYSLVNRLEELKKIPSTDFVMHFLQTMDGEKDPRNLLVLFHCIPLILTHFPLGPFVEDFFEVLSCYFPIDFKPSAPLPGGEMITREDLAKPLHRCLSQTNQFCKYLIPLLMEKLDSSIVDAKLDSLQLLGLCCERSYTVDDLNAYLPTIWHALRREIFMGGDELVETACINFLRSGFRLLSRNPTVLDTGITMVFTECRHHLSEPELRLSQPTARILAAIAQGSEESCQIVLNLTVPLLHEQFSTKPQSSVRKGLLAIMTNLISTVRLHPSVKLATTVPKWDEVLAMWFTLITNSDPEFTLLALNFFTMLLSNTYKRGPGAENNLGKNIDESTSDDVSDLGKKDRILLQEHLLSLLVRSDVTAEVRTTVISLMDEIAKGYGEEFVEISTSKLLAMITSQENELIPQAALHALSECSAYVIVAKSVIPRLLELEFNPKIVYSLASLLEKGCEKNISAEAALEFTDFMWMDFHSVQVISKVSNFAKTYPGDKNRLLLARIVRVLVRSAGESCQQEIVNSLWNGLVLRDGGDCGRILDNDIPPLLLEAILGSLRPSIEILQRSQLMDILLERITTEPIGGDKETSKQNSLNEMASIRLYAVLLNKSDDEEFPVLLTKVEDVFDKYFSSRDQSRDMDTPTTSSEMNENALSKRLITFFTVVVKALAMRGIPDLTKWVDKIVTLLDHPVFGLMLSNELPVLMTDCNFSLNSKSFCRFRFLYRQRLFLESVPKLVAAYQRSSKDSGVIRANYMRALSSQLKHVPGPVLQTQINTVFPLLMASLTVDSSMSDGSSVEMLMSTLTALFDFFKSKSEESSLGAEEQEKETLVEYFHDMVPRLLTLAKFKPSMDVRMLALKCLRCCARLPTHVVLPIKPTVTIDLKSALDDPKRLVRREAQATINIWILVGAPGGV